MNSTTSIEPAAEPRRSRFRCSLERLGFWNERRELQAAVVFVVAAGVFHLSMAVQGWNLPILDAHGFRQTQTAYSARTILEGGPWLAYETPVLGPAWSIPFEFPLYQWFVAAVSYATGLPIDQSGRCVSLAMTWLVIIPLGMLLRHFQFRLPQRLLAIGLYLFNPIYVFWGRAVLIESTALFLSLMFLALAATAERSKLRLAAAAVCGIAAALTKITTLGPFLLVLLCLFAARAYAARFDRGVVRAVVLQGALLSVVALGSGMAWTRYADQVKEKNPIASAEYRSDKLAKWNFGTLEQRLQVRTWARIGSHLVLFGVGWLLPITALLASPVVGPARRRLATVCLVAALSAPLVFTNLHYAHNYYSVANEILLVLAVAVILCSLVGIDQEKTWAGFAACLFGAVQMTSGFYFNYLPVQTAANQRTIELAAVCAQACPTDKTLLILGRDWSSEVPYYSHRRALMLGDISPDLIKTTLNGLDPQTVGAVVIRDAWHPMVQASIGMLNESPLFREWSREGWNPYAMPDGTIVVPSPERSGAPGR